MKTSIKKYVWLLLAATGMLALLAACGDEATPTPSGTTPAQTQGNATPATSPTPLVNQKIGYALTNGPVAKVDSVEISATDFNQAVDDNRVLAEEQNGGPIDWGTPDNKDLLKNIRSDSLEGLINFQVVAEQAAKEGVKASPDDVQQRLDDLKKQLGTPENYKDYLAHRFIMEDDLKKRLSQVVIFDQMSDRHSNVDDKGEQAHVRHILVKTEDEAKTIFQKLQQGGDFAALAKQFSLDFESAQQGGDLGWIFHGQTDQSFENAAFSLQPNQYSGPIKTDKGYHIIQLLAKEVRPLPVDLVQQRKSEAFTNYIKSLRDKAKIEQYLNP
ncbi:MAG TPA: peptidylprolyl isomerase [Chloroflexia bacterium]|nr:peptidylprolyl isomerase [Chloroflexia bacterium]